MKSIGKKAKRYNFYLGKFWPATLILLSSIVAVLVATKFMDANDNQLILTLTGVLLIVSIIFGKCLKLLHKSHQPVISILPDRIILASNKHKEILYTDIDSVKLAESGMQILSQSLVIFLNNTTGNDDSESSVISVPLFFVRADREHLLQLIKLHLGRKAYKAVPPVLGLEWQVI